MDNKVIHYCWFGKKPKPGLFKKCLKSWKKFLPEFEIKEWNEDNIDINESIFLKEAYESKKWAFVADYTRFKVLSEYGGLYLDTDMEITGDIHKFLNEDLVFGMETDEYANGAMIWAKNSNDKHICNIYKIYKEFNDFAKGKQLWEITLPRIITNYFKTIGLIKSEDKIQYLDNNSVVIYPRDYFYPLSFEHDRNKFTNNSVMIHHFGATWISKKDKINLFLKRNKLNFLIKPISIFIDNIRNINYKFKKK